MKAFKNISICLTLIISQLGLVASAGPLEGIIGSAMIAGAQMLSDMTVEVGTIADKIKTACKASQTQSSDGQADDQSDGGTAASGCTLTTSEQDTLQKVQAKVQVQAKDYCNCVNALAGATDADSTSDSNCSPYLKNAKAFNAQVGLLNKIVEKCCPNIESQGTLPLSQLSCE